MTASNLIHASGLFVARSGMPILRDVGLDVAAGEAVALLGGNGSGKTTLIRTLLGLLPFQQGQVELFGTPLAKFSSWHRIGYVPQHSAINVSQATVREIAAAGRLAHLRPFQWLRSSDRRALDDALAQVGLLDRAAWPFNALSGGQKQRVLIARALTAKPELLVMDEPMAGVDLHSQDGLAQLLKGFRDAGLGVLTVLHERGAMAEILDRSITLCDGRVVAADHPGSTACAPSTAVSSLTGLTDPIAGA